MTVQGISIGVVMTMSSIIVTILINSLPPLSLVGDFFSLKTEKTDIIFGIKIMSSCGLTTGTRSCFIFLPNLGPAGIHPQKSLIFAGPEKATG